MLRTLRWIVGTTLVLVTAGAVYLWMEWRVDVGPDDTLVLIRKVGDPLPPGQKIAEAGQKGIQRLALGPGRYFLNPWVWDFEQHGLIEVPAGDPLTWRQVYLKGAAEYDIPKAEGAWPKVGVVNSLAGKPAPPGSEVVDEGFQGIHREVLTPGTYRINPRAYEVKLVNATVIPLGCVGVVTSQLGEMPDVEVVKQTSIGPDGQVIEDPHPKTMQKLARVGQRGILSDVLPPGIYYLNPFVHKTKIVQIGYNEISQLRSDNIDVISFPSRDGFTIEVEVTVVWGRHPEHAAQMINRFGEVQKLQEIMLDNIRSVCRNLGSDYDSTDFIRGEKRELYQLAVTETLKLFARARDIEILIALIHNIEVRGGTAAEGEAADLKQTIQRGFIAREEELTRQKQRETAVVKAELATAKADIEVAREQIVSDTRKKVAEVQAEGQKKAREIDAQRDLEVAQIERQIATLDAETTRILGTAKADVQEMKFQAEADGKRMMVEALGTGRAYNLYTFAREFSPESIRLIFAGEGTFWTDLGKMQDAAAATLLEAGEAARPSRGTPK